MKNLTTPRARRWLKSKMLTALILTTTATYTQAQLIQNNEFYTSSAGNRYWNVKNYSTAVVPNAQEIVMAGTIHEPSPVNNWSAYGDRAHFLRLDEDGVIIKSVVYSFSSLQAIDDEYVRVKDNRVVSIVPATLSTGQNVYYIVMSARAAVKQPWLTNPPTTPPFFNGDRIRILMVDNDGVIIDQTLIESEEASLYPMDAIYTFHNQGGDPTTQERYLYICGYTGPSGYYGHQLLHENIYPIIEGDKQAFVIKVNVNSALTANFNGMAGKFFDYPKVITSPPYDEDDYDIAMRMIEIQHASTGYHSDNGDIWVTGSTSAETGIPGFNTYIRSAVMNLLLDPGLNIKEDRPFIATGGNGDGYGVSEYGIGLVEVEGQGGNYEPLIVSNTFWKSDQFPNHPDDPQVPGISIKPEYMHLTRIQPGQFFLPSNPERWMFDKYHQCAVDIIPDATDPKYSVIVGKDFNDLGDVVPTLTHIPDLIIPGGGLYYTFSTQAMHHYYPTTTGTGNPYNDISYFQLGGGMASIYHNSQCASSFTGSTQRIMMSGPKLINDSLGLRFITVNATTFDDPGGGANSCGHIEEQLPVNEPGLELTEPGVPSTPTLGYVTSDLVYGDMEYDQVVCDLNNHRNIGSASQEILKTSIYPNPAYATIQVQPATAVAQDAEVKVQMINIQGQSLGMLYEGEASALKTGRALNLPTVPTGLYIIQVYVNGKPESQHKLQVQK